MKLVVNSVVYDFTKTAEGGVVVSADDYSSIEFISPDNRLDYDLYKTMTVGETLDAIEEILEVDPIPAWDKFAEWVGGQGGILDSLMDGMVSCELTTIDGAIRTEVNMPNFGNVSDGLSFMHMLEETIEIALTQPLSDYGLDTHVFGCALYDCLDDHQLTALYQLKKKVDNCNCGSGGGVLFYGTGTGVVPEITADMVINLANTKQGPTEGYSFNIDVPVGQQYIAIAYPDSLRDLSNVTYVQANDTSMAANFTAHQVEMNDGGNEPTNYKVFTYGMAIPAVAAMNFKVTI